MRDEEQTRLAAELIAQPSVVERRHHCLAGAGSRHEQIAVAVVAITLRLQLLQHSRLMRLGRHVEGDEAATEVARFSRR